MEYLPGASSGRDIVAVYRPNFNIISSDQMWSCKRLA